RILPWAIDAAPFTPTAECAIREPTRAPSSRRLGSYLLNRNSRKALHGPCDRRAECRATVPFRRARRLAGGRADRRGASFRRRGAARGIDHRSAPFRGGGRRSGDG